MQRQARPHFLNYSLVVWIFWILGAVATPLSSVRADGPLTAETPRMIGPGPTVDSESLSQEEWGPADTPGQFERPTPEAPPTGTTIEGINFDEDAANGGFFHIPPDPHGAAGPSHVVSIVNTSIEWFTKAGVAQNSQRLGKNATTHVGSFFASLTPVNPTFDPKIIYDQYNDRFVVVTLELQDTSRGDPVNASRILLAVSDDSNPNGTWRYLAINSKINIRGADRWADYPGFAVDEEAVYVTANMFGFGGGGSVGVRLWIIAKGAGSGGFYDGGAASVTVHNPYASVGFAVTTQPAHMFGTGPAGVGTFLVSYDGLSDGTNEFVQVVRVDNPLTSPTFSQQLVAVGNIDNTAIAVPGAPQSGTANTIDAGDRRAINAVWRNNSLWLAADVVPGSGADTGQTTAHWWQINTTTLASLSVTQQGNVGGEDIAASTHTFYPSVAVDGSGNMGTGFAASAPTLFPGAYYTGRLSTDGAGTVQPSGVLAAGVDSYFRIFSNVRNRWGDYSAITIDPSDDATFWVFNEYALTRGTVLGQFLGQDGRWGTRFGSFTFSTSSGAIFQDDMESGVGGWLATGSWGQTTTASHSPTHSWTDSPGGNYGNNQFTALFSPPIDLTGLSGATLRFWHRFAFGSGDAGYVIAKPGNGDWVFVGGAFSGTDLSWHQEAISLSVFAGQTVVLAFLFTSDASGTADGWYVDDVSVTPSTAIFADDMESGVGGWFATGSWGQTTTASHSPTHSWTDSPGGNYSNNQFTALFSPPINLAGQSSAILTFWHRFAFGSGDAGYVLVNSNGNWAFVGAFSGTDLSWHQEAVSLSAYVGQTVVVAFLFTSDASGTADGWYIDDVSVAPSSGAVFQDNIEGGIGGWLATGTWGQTTTAAHSPTHSWTDSPGGNYSNNQFTALFSPPINLAGQTSAILTFWHRFAFGSGDAGYVIAKPGNGDWVFVGGAFSGTDLSWHQEAISLSAFAGQTVVVAFLFTSDASGTADGWYIDDVSVGP